MRIATETPYESPSGAACIARGAPRDRGQKRRSPVPLGVRLGAFGASPGPAGAVAVGDDKVGVTGPVRVAVAERQGPRRLAREQGPYVFGVALVRVAEWRGPFEDRVGVLGVAGGSRGGGGEARGVGDDPVGVIDEPAADRLEVLVPQEVRSRLDHGGDL